MFLNYTTVAIRRLLKNKIYLLINVLGVGIAIASAMTAYLLVAYNIEFDSTVDEGRVKNIVKVVHHRKQADGDSFKQLVAPLPLGPSTAEDIAGVKNFTRYCSIGGYISHNGNGFHETIFFADSAFMNMFRPELISGSHQNFGDRNSIFISEKFARKYFGTEDPVGKELTVYANSKTTIVNVGGVLKDVPFNSTFTYNALMRMENFISTLNYKENDWASNETASTLFELTDIRHAHTIARQLQRYVSMRNEFQAEARSVSYELLPFMTAISPNDMRGSDLHLRIPNIALFTFILMGSIILLIACFNLTNTTLALSMKRLKEIGIRKVVGSARWQIAFQFFVEIVLTIAFAGIVGFALSLYLIPEFAAMWELPYGLKELNSMNIVIALMVLLFTCALVAGSYPALFASGLNPIVLFRGSKNAGGTNLLTRTLLVTQFSLSIIVLIAGVMFSRNAFYQDTLSFGYDKDQIITALIQGPREAEALSNAIYSNPKIESTAPSVHHFAFINAPERPAQIADDKFNATVYDISPEYFNAVGLRFINGHPFNRTDSTSVVVDNNFVRRKQLADPIGSQVEIEGVKYAIVGVVTNHLTDLESHNNEDYIYRLANPEHYQILIVRGEASTLEETKKYIDNEWRKLFPDKPLRTDLQRDILYAEANAYNHNLGKIFMFLTILGCTLSVSGLYSMASLNIQKRRKEIGVRKVLGASMFSILRLINKEFAIILLVAGIPGSAGGFFLTDGLLSSLYAQHITIDILPLIACSSFVMIVGIAATSATIWWAAMENPAKTLRRE